MLLDKKIEITIFQMDDVAFEPIGMLDEYTSLAWPDAFLGQAMFQLWAPITDKNAELLKEGRVVWCGGENAAIIKIVKADINEDGEKEYNIKGWTLENILIDRVLLGTFNYGVKYTSGIMYDLVDKCCINPSDTKRKIPYLKNAEDKNVGLKLERYQKTGGSVYDACSDLASNADVGFSVLFNPYDKELLFEVRGGVDRTQEQTSVDPVVFSTELEDILSSSYYLNVEDVKNVAYVQGEEKADKTRATVISGNNSTAGFGRRELYVDARDLQSTSQDENGQQVELTPAEYNAVLLQRGNEKLSENVKTETFEAQIRQFGDVQYVFGEDYQKGDKVTVIDYQLGLSVSARITQVEEDFAEEYKLVLTFGYSYPTLLQKVKRVSG